MGPSTSDLLGGPRGRRLCFELVRRRAEPLGERLTRRSELARAVAAMDLPALARLGEPPALVPALADSVSWARYWQEPDEVDAALGDPELAGLLEPVASAVLRSPASSWWSDPVDGDQQWQVRWRWGEPDDPGGGAAERLARWRRRVEADEERARRQRPAAVTANVSGDWWSTPALSGLVSTTGAVPGSAGAPVELFLLEDAGDEDRAEVRPARVDPGARVYEVTGPAAWAALTATYPLPVTSSRRHDWYRATGWDRQWLVPDWQAVAGDWDGVHLTLAGYLSTAGTPLAVGADGSTGTLLAGWDPGATWWLTDVVSLGPAVPWVRGGELLDWAPAGPGP